MFKVADIAPRTLPDLIPPPEWFDHELMTTLQDQAIEVGAGAFFMNWAPDWIDGGGSAIAGTTVIIITRAGNDAYEFSRAAADEAAFLAAAADFVAELDALTGE